MIDTKKIEKGTQVRYACPDKHCVRWLWLPWDPDRTVYCPAHPEHLAVEMVILEVRQW